MKTKKNKLSKIQKRVLERLEETEDYGITISELNISNEDVKKWRQSNTYFNDMYLIVIGLTSKQELFLSKFRKKMCNVQATCRTINISRSTHYAWMNKSDTYKKEVISIREELFDDVESKMYEEIFIKGNSTMMIFMAKTQMKHRGYVEKVESVNTNINIENERVKNMTDEELDAAIEEMKAGKKR